MPEPPAGRWQRLSDSRVGTCFSTFLDSRAAKVGYGVLALAPLADVITDLLTAGNFWLLGHRWWACLTLGIVYMNCRFTIVFMALCMLPSLRNFVSMYLPAAWPWCRCRSGDVEDGQGAAPSGLSKVFKKVKNFRDRLRKALGKEQSSRYEQLLRMNENRCTDTALKLFMAGMERCTSIDGGDSKCLLRLRLGLMALAMEIPLIPLSIFAIYPIGRTSVMLCAVYMRQAFGYSTATAESFRHPHDEDLAAELYLVTVSLVEALFESVPQLALQIYIGIYVGNVDGWVFILSTLISACSVVKALVFFALDRKKLIPVLKELQKAKGIRND